MYFIQLFTEISLNTTLENSSLLSRKLITAGPSSKDKMLRVIDNPGQGACAPYAFLIGLLHLAKNHERFDMIEKWRQFDEEVINKYQDIFEGNTINIQDFDAFSKNEEILDPLMFSLRNLICSKSMLIRELEFRSLCEWAFFQKMSKIEPHIQIPADYQSLAMQSNLLFSYGHEEIFYQANWVAQEFIQQTKDIRNFNNIANEQAIMQSLVNSVLNLQKETFDKFYKVNIGAKQTYLSESHLIYLAEYFDVEYVIKKVDSTKNIEKTPETVYKIPKKPFIHLINIGNIHWMTALYDSEYPYQVRSLADTQALVETQIQIDFRVHVNDFFNQHHREAFKNNQHLIVSCFQLTEREIKARINQYLQLLDLFELGNNGTDEQKLAFIQKLNNDNFFRLFRDYCDKQGNTSYCAIEGPIHELNNQLVIRKPMQNNPQFFPKDSSMSLVVFSQEGPFKKPPPSTTSQFHHLAGFIGGACGLVVSGLISYIPAVTMALSSVAVPYFILSLAMVLMGVLIGYFLTSHFEQYFVSGLK